MVSWAPIVSLLVGILALLDAWSVWHWADEVSTLGSYVNPLCSTYAAGYQCGVTSRFSTWLWLSVIFLAIEGILYIVAYPGLRDRKKVGWNYIYYGALLNVAYAIVSLFTSYDVVSSFAGAVIGSAIAFYLLFQIREAYLGTKHSAPTPPKA